MKDTHRHLARLLNGEASPESLAWLQAGFRRWLQPDNALDLGRCLGLGTPSKCRDQLRNDLLRQAAGHLEGVPTTRAEQLARLCADMEARLWPLWKDEQTPPERAGPVLSLLWRAKRTGASLNLGVRRIFDLIG